MSESVRSSQQSSLNAEERASVLSRTFFWWIVPYLKVFRKSDLDFDDLLTTRAADDPELLHQQLQNVRSKGRRGIFLALIVANKLVLLRAMFFAILLACCSTLIPITFRWFLELLVSSTDIVTLLPALLTVGCVFFMHSIAVHHMFFSVLRATQRASVVIPPLIFEKISKLSFSALQEVPTGNVVNLIATDANRISWFFNLTFSFMVHPLQVFGTLWVLYTLLGTAGLLGSIALISCLLLAIASSRVQAKIKKKALTIADSRVALISEVLTSIKLIKLYGWEEPRALQIKELRARETRLLKRAVLLEGLNIFLFGAAPILFSVIAISCMIKEGREVRLVELLPALSALATLRFALSAIPGAIQALFDARVSARRIDSFLESEEAISASVLAPSSEYKIETHELSSNWSNGTIALRSASIVAKPGEIIAVTGPVGAGKTALLLSLHGELPITRGKLAITESRQYVPQTPWILSASIRDNILMGATYDERWYREILSATALEEDLTQLPQGDLTIIGERGVNLSGGQRQRVALARAAYRCPEALLLDDPLSALDPTVASRVFESLMRKVLKNSAIILVTHRPEFARACDRCFSVNDGEVVPLQFSSLQTNEIQSSHLKIAGPQLKPPDNASSAVSEEERFVGVVNRTTINSYIGRFTAAGWGIGLLCLFLIREVSVVGLDLWLALLGRGVEVVVNLGLIGLIAIGSVVVLLNYARIALTLIHGIELSSAYHSQLVQGVLSAPLNFFSSNPVGRIINRFSRDIFTIQDSVPRMLHDFVSCTLSVAVIASVLIFSSPLVIIVIIPVFALYLWAQSVYRPASRECQRLDSVSRSPVLSLLGETYAGLTSLRGSKNLLILQQRMFSAVRTQGRAFYSMVGCNRWLGLMVESLSSIVVVATFAIAVRSAEKTDLAIVALGLTLVLSISSTLNWLIRSLSLLEAGLTSAERIEYYSATESEESPNAKSVEERILANWPNDGAIDFNDATFAYRKDLSPSIRDVNLSIKSGERIGIIGRTGAGKSTLLMGLFRAIEKRAGVVKISGVDSDLIPRSILRRRLGYIPQEPTILSGSVRENIDPFNEFNDQQIWDVLERAQLASTVRSFPKELLFELNEGGNNLSHGQRQLICLARILIKQPKVVVLDEATSSVDPVTDALIQKTIRTEFRDSTIITIAHRIETILDYDRVVMVAGGEILAIGKPNDLLKNIKSESELDILLPST